LNRQVVVDASAFVACVLPDESASRELVDTLVDAEFILPSLWPAEVANTLLMAERRGRIDQAGIIRILDRLGERPLSIEPAGLELALRATEVARICSLTIYDAAYLELAIRRALPFATLDRQLKAAAKKMKVKVV